jgi:hypothetical protein
MSTQRKLTALLHELQHAKSPLAQARVLARSWRTLRDLSPTDRRLLARHAGFDGAEDFLEGLGQRKGGLAPAMLLRVLANARGTDGSAVSELLAAVRDPQRRDEALSLGAELASDLLAEPPPDNGPEEIDGAFDEQQAVEASIIETPKEALAALNVFDAEKTEGMDAEPVPEPETDVNDEAEEEPIPIPEPETPPPSPMVDWSRWHGATESRRPAPAPREASRPSISDTGLRRFEARAVMGEMGAQKFVFSQLRLLRRELSGFTGSSTGTLSELIEAFPDGWARRRALCALLEAGIPGEIGDALKLVACLAREFDRRWCLSLLGRRGDLRGSSLSRALEMVDSGYSKRRLAALAGKASHSASPYILRSS